MRAVAYEERETGLRKSPVSSTEVPVLFKEAQVSSRHL